ncbi:GTPase ObgE [Limisphaera sp. VF-2]|uniref:GTPase ObgE n=1 Tax=Limisphaera sp. VF-2 TaxID=3400418 RepID=UPI00175364A1|nr:GTPase ObgE [Limisphaera sp.]
MFVDEVKIYARAGHGGRGCVAFRREKFRPKGGPDGGDGGDGGSVILRADHDLNNLIAQYYQPRLIAEDGEHGMGKGMKGRSGRDLIVPVPCGTLVWRLHPPEPAEPPPSQSSKTVLPTSVRTPFPYAGRMTDPKREPLPLPPRVSGPIRGVLVADLTEHGQEFVLCRGGRGGLGNKHFATPTRQAPRFAQPGEPGEEGEFLLELRMIADVGLVGYPNAGKSTLLTAISRARPKIAPYPFTTLHPQIGIVEYPDYRRLVVCDVPGLIEGAHRNVGLGHAFLRHIERCKVLVILLDMAGTDGRFPWDDYRHLLEELELYDPGLLDRPRLVVANKMDEPAAEGYLRRFKRRVPHTPVLTMSAALGEGVERFKRAIRQAVDEAATGSPVSAPARLAP